MRQGRAEDLAAVLDLWAEDVRAGRRDCVPNVDRMRRMLAGFDWESSSRIVEGPDGHVEAAVLVSSRAALYLSLQILAALETLLIARLASRHLLPARMIS
jgi:hypothetical protein